MLLFGTAGGLGAGADACFCFCPTLLSLGGAAVASLLALVNHSTRALGIAAMFVGYAGFVVTVLVLTVRPSDDPDERENVADAWWLFWWWAACTAGTALVAIRVITAKRAAQKRNPPPVEVTPPTSAEQRPESQLNPWFPPADNEK